MDELFSKLAGQVVTLAGKAAFGLVTKVALDQMNKVINKSSPAQATKLKRLLQKFELKIEVLTPAIELMELSLSRGNRALESVIEMTDQLQNEIKQFNKETFQLQSASTNEAIQDRVSNAIVQLTGLISQLDSVTGYLQLALSLVGGNIHSQISTEISASRLLQASALLSAVDRSVRFGDDKHYIVGKGLYFTLYRLFSSSSRPKDKSDFTWKEEYAICKGHLERGKDITLYSYDLVLTEDFDDGRYHEEDQSPQTLRFSVLDIQRMYYTSSGKLLNIEDITSPVLVLKIKTSGTPSYFALGLKASSQAEDSDDDLEEKAGALAISEKHSGEDSLIITPKTKEKNVVEELLPFPPSRKSGELQISALSLFEYILRLAAVEASQQKSHLLVPDEMLTRYIQGDQVSPSTNGNT